MIIIHKIKSEKVPKARCKGVITEQNAICSTIYMTKTEGEASILSRPTKSLFFQVRPINISLTKSARTNSFFP